MWTGNPAAQSMIEPVSDLRLQIFGNIAESTRRFSTELSGDLIIREAGDRWLMLRNPATARLSRRLSHQTQRPDWLADGAVLIGPVSVAYSLLIGKFTGNFTGSPLFVCQGL